ncbi:hypothetical protein RF11_03566 [Thelohanellus kitauei]|uniref:Uncharacterized protein n=1 Tax=Thelohanellus kitauei TaxID=669202 RepID=A0A0C2MTH3_THEKT|nr:hypothetical protein RF11_03566 [Thelohanellus kitauei]
MLKYYHINRNYVTKHAEYASTLSTEDIFRKDNIPKIAATRENLMQFLCDAEFVKICMLDVVDQVGKEHRKKFEKMGLSRRTTARRMNAIDEDENLRNLDIIETLLPEKVFSNAWKILCINGITIAEIYQYYDRWFSSFTGKNIGQQRTMSDHAVEVNSNNEMIFSNVYYTMRYYAKLKKMLTVSRQEVLIMDNLSDILKNVVPITMISCIPPAYAG